MATSYLPALCPRRPLQAQYLLRPSMHSHVCLQKPSCKAVPLQFILHPRSCIRMSISRRYSAPPKGKGNRKGRGKEKGKGKGKDTPTKASSSESGKTSNFSSPQRLTSLRARSRLGRSSKRLVVDQLFSRCSRTGEKQKARCLPKSKQKNKHNPKQTQQRKTPRKQSETLRFQKIKSS